MEFITENLGKIGFEWKLGLFNLINFLILYWILKRLLFKPILKAMNDRRDQINESVDNIKKAQTELAMAEQNAKKVRDAAKVDSNNIIAAAHDDAKELATEMKQKTKEEIETLVEQARKKIDAEKQKMREEVKTEIVDTVMLGVEKLVEEKVDTKNDKVFIEKTLKNITT